MKRGFLLLALLLIASTAMAKDVTLSWEQSPSDLGQDGGYKVYYSNTNEMPFSGDQGDLSAPIDVGNVTSYTVTGLPDEVGFYFYVSAYNSVKQESGPSNIVYSQGFAPPDAPAALSGKSTVNTVDVPLQ